MKGKTWTKEEISILRDNYPLNGPSYCSKLLPGRTIKACSTQANKLGLKFDNSWTLKDIEFLKEYYPIKGAEFCAIKLNRTIYSIQKRASIERVSFLTNGRPRLTDNETIVYHISFEHQGITYYKLGITCKSLKQRFSGQWKSLNMKILWIRKFNNGLEAYNYEQALRLRYSKYLIKTNILYSGNTEVFSIRLAEKSP